jgi:hypothetical protein
VRRREDAPRPGPNAEPALSRDRQRKYVIHDVCERVLFSGHLLCFRLFLSCPHRPRRQNGRMKPPVNVRG